MSTPRRVVIDDTDSRIHYSGQGWFQDQGSQDNAGTWGPTYNRTSHGTNGNDSLSFTFEGTYIVVYGTTHLARIDNNTQWDPGWECFIDGISIGMNSNPFPGLANPYPYAENNWWLCGKTTLNDGQHEITVNVTSAGNTFWLDYIVFTPSPKASFDEAVLIVDNGDPAIFLDSNWHSYLVDITNVNGSQAKFDFVGKSVTWVGIVPTEFPHAPASGSFAVDGGPPTSFKLNGLPPTANTTMYNQRFFTTPDLSPGPHSLLVTYNGIDNQTTPLTFDYLYVTNISTPNPSSTSTSVPTITSVINTPTQGGSSTTPVGAIVGGVIGGIALIALVFFLFWWRRRALLVHSEPRPTLNGTSSVPYEVTPFMSGYQTPQSYTTYPSSSPQTLPNSLPPIGVGTVAQLHPMRKGQEGVPSTTVAAVHQDSGLRLPQQNVIVQDIPPSYTVA